LLTGLALINLGIANLREAPPLTTVVLQIIGIATGILLLVGLWTPVAGSVAAVVEALIALSLFLSHSADPRIALIQAILGAALAMVGPGAWSVDARLFGRKHIKIRE
jgi:uncharacterized membrane protein YphA (DoxX/SURF4 family)